MNREVQSALRASCEDPETLVAIYDGTKFPLSFDIITFLVAATACMDEIGKRRIFLILLRGEKPDAISPGVTRGETDALSAWRSRNILISCLPLFPSIGGYVVLDDRNACLAFISSLLDITFPTLLHPSDNLPGIYTHLSRNLQPNRRDTILLAPKPALACVKSWLDANCLNRRPIAITLRGRVHDKDRNSQIGEWLDFAASLDPDKYVPIIVPDTDQALIPCKIPQNSISFGLAAFDISLRLALYELAWLNLWTVHGPAILGHLSTKCRYISFSPLPDIEDNSYYATLKSALDSYGYVVGKTPDFAVAGQQWVWKQDTCSTIQTEFNKAAQLLERGHSMVATSRSERA